MCIRDRSRASDLDARDRVLWMERHFGRETDAPWRIAVPEAERVLAETEPQEGANWQSWHVRLGQGAQIACGPLSDPYMVSVDAALAEGIAEWLAEEGSARC